MLCLGVFCVCTSVGIDLVGSSKLSVCNAVLLVTREPNGVDRQFNASGVKGFSGDSATRAGAWVAGTLPRLVVLQLGCLTGQERAVWWLV